MPRPLTNFRVDFKHKLRKAGAVELIEPILASSYFNLLCQIFENTPSRLLPSQLEWMANYLNMLCDQATNDNQRKIIRIFAPSIIAHCVKMIPVTETVSPFLSESARNFILAFPELVSTACESLRLPPDLYREYVSSNTDQKISDNAAMWEFVNTWCWSPIKVNDGEVEVRYAVKQFLNGDYDANPVAILAMARGIIYEFRYYNSRAYKFEQLQTYLKEFLFQVFDKKYFSTQERIEFIKLFLTSYAQEHNESVAGYSPYSRDYLIEDENFRSWTDLTLFLDLFLPPVCYAVW